MDIGPKVTATSLSGSARRQRAKRVCPDAMKVNYHFRLGVARQGRCRAGVGRCEPGAPGGDGSRVSEYDAARAVTTTAKQSSRERGERRSRTLNYIHSTAT